MQKTIIIDGQEVKFKASASIVYRYKAQFNKDLLDIAMPLVSTVLAGYQEGKIDFEALIEKAAYTLELTDLYNLIWVMAKTGDNSIPEPIEWYDKFEVFPGIDIAKELFEILLPSMLTTEESKKKLMKKARVTATKSQPQRSSQPQKSEESTLTSSTTSPGDS